MWHVDVNMVTWQHYRFPRCTNFGIFGPIRGPIESCHVVVRTVYTLMWRANLARWKCVPVRGHHMAQSEAGTL
jgi:hypothetical protein